MTGVMRTSKTVPGWTFEIDEISAGVYRVHGEDEVGRIVEATGTDPDALLAECQEQASKIANRTRSR
jgi:hypothetical protein